MNNFLLLIEETFSPKIELMANNFKNENSKTNSYAFIYTVFRLVIKDKFVSLLDKPNNFVLTHFKEQFYHKKFTMLHLQSHPTFLNLSTSQSFNVFFLECYKLFNMGVT